MAKYIIFLDSGTAKCLNVDAGTIDSSSATHDVPIQYAIDNAGGRAIFIRNGLYTLTTTLDGVDKEFALVGELMDEFSDQSVQTTLKKSHSGTLLDLENSGSASVGQKLKDLTLHGNDNTGIGLRGNYIRYHHPFMDNVRILNCDKGMVLTNSWYVHFNNITITSCADTGLELDNDGTPSTLQDGPNTMYFNGGRIQNCDVYNIHVKVTNNDILFMGIICENDGDYTNLIRCEERARDCVFFRMSLEEFSPNNDVMVYDTGGNNRYEYLRMTKSANTDMTAFQFGSTAQSCVVSNCTFTGSSPNNIYLQVDSGADDIQFLNNHRGRWIARPIIVTDNGTDTMWWGNDNNYIGNKIANDTTLHEGVDFLTGTSTGTRICTSSSQKLGFYGATPITRAAANADTSGATLEQLETEVNQLKQLLRDYGLMAP